MAKKEELKKETKTVSKNETTKAIKKTPVSKSKDLSTENSKKDVKKSTNIVHKTKKVAKKLNDSPKTVDEKTQKSEVVEKVLVNESDKSHKSIVKLVITLLIIALIVGSFILSIIQTAEKTKYFKSVTYNEVNELINGSETNVIYWASPTCGYCTQFKPIVLEVSHDYEQNFYYLNTNSLTSEDSSHMYEYFDEYDSTYSSTGLGTPSLIFVREGKIVDISSGVLTRDGLIELLDKNGLVNQENK